MKIAMIGHKRIPSREGGVEIVVEELSTRLVKKKHQVDVYNRKGKNVQDKNVDKEKKKLKEYKGIRLITIPTINKKGIDALLYSFFATIRALFGKYDVIHYHAEGPCAMLWIPHLFGIKTVATIHGLDWQRSKWGGFATKYIKFGEKIAAKYADEIIVLSKGVQKYFKDTYNRDTNFIPNGVNKPEIKEANIIKEKWGLEKDNYILFLARIVPEKGLHYLIDAYKQIDTDKKLVIAGGASHTNDYLEKIKDMAKDDHRIIMTGFVQGQELEELYSNCYLYCLPSDVEGMPISLLEAMSYGCNCLVSDIEENTQVTKEYSTTFEKGNVNDLKEKLANILNSKNKLEEEKISNFVLEKYDWKEVMISTEKVYKNKKINKKSNMFKLVILIVSIVVFILNFILENKVVKLLNYTYIYTLITVIFLVKNNSKLELNVPLLIVAFYTLMIGICPVAGAIGAGNYYEEQYSFIIISYLAMFLGYIFYKNITSIKLNKKDEKENEFQSNKDYNKMIKLVAIMLIVVSLIASIYYVIINYANLFGGDLENGRIRAMSGNGIILQMMKLCTISGIILFDQYMKKKLNLFEIILYNIIIIATNLITGFRTGILSYFIMLVLIYNRTNKINIKKMIFLFIPVFIILIIFGSLRGGLFSNNSTSVMQNTLTSLQVGSINLRWILDEFPIDTNYQYGYTYLINLIMLRPGPDVDFTLWLKDVLQVNFDGGGVTPTLIGEFYINFGYIGTYICMFMFGILCYILEEKYNSSSNVGFVVFIIITVLGIGTFKSGLATIEIGIVTGTVTYLSCHYIAKKYQYIINKKNKLVEGKK